MAAPENLPVGPTILVGADTTVFRPDGGITQVSGTLYVLDIEGLFHIGTRQILAGPGVPDPGEPPTLPGDQVTVTYEQMNAYLEREIKGWQPA